MFWASVRVEMILRGLMHCWTGSLVALNVFVYCISSRPLLVRQEMHSQEAASRLASTSANADPTSCNTRIRRHRFHTLSSQALTDRSSSIGPRWLFFVALRGNRGGQAWWSDKDVHTFATTLVITARTATLNHSMCKQEGF
jgi:hypothetical protein